MKARQVIGSDAEISAKSEQEMLRWLNQAVEWFNAQKAVLEGVAGEARCCDKRRKW